MDPGSDYDMLEEDNDQPGPSTGANSAHKRTASTPPASLPPATKKHRVRQPVKTTATSSSGSYRPPPLPHYTVVRAAHNSKQSPHRIIINPGVSDAHPDRWPPEEDFSPSRKVDGKENWYERTPKDGGRHKAFRDKVGEELAKSLKLSQRPNEFWTLDALPDNYLFTVHHNMGGGKPRTDVYVWGNPKVLKFRTANEMTPHIHWLLVHGPNDAIACQCKYCAKMTQGDVNRQLGLPLKQSAAAATAGGSSSSSSPAPRGSSPATGPRVKHPVNYYRPSALALALGGGAGGSGPPSTSSSSGYGNAAAARVASFHDPGGDRLLGPNATPAAIARAKRRHAKELDEMGGKMKDKHKGKGKAKEREEDRKHERKKKKKKKKGLMGGAVVGSNESDEYGDSADFGDSDDDDDDDEDPYVGVAGTHEGYGDGGDLDGEYGPSYRGAFTNRMRDEDLERAAAPRRGELVWAELPRPLLGTKGGKFEGKVVMHWPGIVENREIRNEAVVVVEAAVGEDDDAAEAAGGGDADKATTAAAAVAIPARPGTTLRLPPPPRLTTVPSTRYSVRLLAVADTIRLLREDQVLPWMRHAGAISLFEGFYGLLRDPEAVKHIWDGKGFVRDTLLFEEEEEAAAAEEGQGSGSGSVEPKTLDEALMPLGLAMQIAAHLITTFTLNDRYNVTDRFLTPVDPTDPVQVQEREKQLRSWAFQSTYFGAELVWTGDFVRVIEADGNAFEGIKYESPPTSLGQRALFMKVFAIYKVNSGDDQPGLVKLAGELWELRDFASTTTTTTTAAAAVSVAQGEVVATATPSGSGAAEMTAAGTAVSAAEGQSAMRMFEKRPSPVRVDGPASASTLPIIIAGTPSTPPDTPPARGAASSAAAKASSTTTTFDSEALNLPPPPAGFYWFRLTTSTEQVHLPIDYLAGRYHPLPKELNSPAKIRETLERLEQFAGGEDLTDDDVRAVLLAGLGPAYRLINRCGRYVGDRRTALVMATQDAERDAKPGLEGKAVPADAPEQDAMARDEPAPRLPAEAA